MKKINIFYWICTGMVVGSLGVGSVMELITPGGSEPVTRLGYPEYLAPFLAISRLLAVAVILIPKFPRLKEWAYAGIAFDLIGAIYSHLAFGDPVTNCIFIILPGTFLAGSYILYHQKLKNLN